jgi:hypothetical protein
MKTPTVERNYEIVLFSQNGGLQQIYFHEQGDTYAIQIAERFKFCRIKNSK